MNSKVLSRLCIFFFGFPLVIALILLKQYNHIVLHTVIAPASFLASAELYNIFSHNFKLQNKGVVIVLSGLIHLTMVASALCACFFDITPENINTFVTAAYIGAILISLGWEVFSQNSFEDSNSHIVTSITIITYIGYLFTFLSRMTFFEHSREILIMFLTMVFLCDSLAWFFGVLFGKNNKGFIKASPNKSIAGFMGGILGSILSGAICWYLWNAETGIQNHIFEGSIVKLICLGAVMSLCSITGDLAESVFKRSGDCKDSGTIVPGRGGILDSIDSIIFSAPVFYFIITHLYQGL